MASNQERLDAAKFWALILAAAGISIVAGRAAAEFPPLYVFAAAAGLAIALVSFTFPKVGLAIVIFSMIFSPRVAAGHISDSYRHGSAMFTLNDILLIVIFLSWLARTA